MIEKALIVIIFMYATSFGVLGAQYVLGDIFGVQIKNYEGVPIESNLLDIVRLDNLNAITANIVSANYTENQTSFDRIEDSTTAAAFVAWELVLLMTGTYIFNILILFGVPEIIVAGMVIIYVLLLARAIIAYIRGI